MNLQKYHYEAAALVRHGYSEAEIATKLSVTKDSVKAWKENADFIALVFSDQQQNKRSEDNQTKSSESEVERAIRSFAKFFYARNTVETHTPAPLQSNRTSEGGDLNLDVPF